jgi:alpha-amylase
MIKFRSVVGDARLWNWGDNGQDQIAFCRGDLGFIAINAEIRMNMNINMKACVPPGTYCDVITGKSGKT